MKLYLSGPISADDPKLKEKNLARFHEAEKKLTNDVVEIINPAALEGECGSWEEYLARDLLLLSTERPDIYMLFGWRDSLGARLELEFAKKLDLVVHYEE